MTEEETQGFLIVRGERGDLDELLDMVANTELPVESHVVDEKSSIDVYTFLEKRY